MQEMSEMQDDFYIKEIELKLVNCTKEPVYLNREFTPGGVLITKGTTWIDGDCFFIVNARETPLKVTISSKEWGRKETRWVQEAGKSYKLTRTGSAVGLTHMRGFNGDGIAHVTVTVEGVK